MYCIIIKDVLSSGAPISRDSKAELCNLDLLLQDGINPITNMLWLKLATLIRLTHFILKSGTGSGVYFILVRVAGLSRTGVDSSLITRCCSAAR